MIADLIKLYADANIRVAELERQNAALLADKERLDWMASADYWADIAVYRTPKGLRAAIDAARKEAQP